MDKKLICDNKFHFSIPNKVIALSVALDSLPKQLIIEGDNFLLKDSFHVSLVCIGEIIRKHNISISYFENKMIDDFCEFSKTNDIKVLEYSDFRIVKKDSEWKTIVVMCKVSNLENFFKNLNKKYGLQIECPPTHITLYTTESKPGIFLTDMDDIKNLTKLIHNPVNLLLGIKH